MAAPEDTGQRTSNLKGLRSFVTNIASRTVSMTTMTNIPNSPTPTSGATTTRGESSGWSSEVDTSLDPSFLYYLESKTVFTYTGFTKRQNDLLQASWERLIGPTEETFRQASHQLLFWMLDEIPGMQKMFGWGKMSPKSRHHHDLRENMSHLSHSLRHHSLRSDPRHDLKSRQDLMKDEQFLEHANQVMQVLNSFIRLLVSPDILQQAFTSLASVHVFQTPRVEAGNFRIFRDNFHKFLHSTLGLDRQSEEVQLWESLLNIFLSEVVRHEKEDTRGEELCNSRQKTSCCTLL